MANQNIERLATGSGQSLEFQLPDVWLVPLPARFVERYPEMKIWQESDRTARQQWKAKCELKIREEFDKVRNTMNGMIGVI